MLTGVARREVAAAVFCCRAGVATLPRLLKPVAGDERFLTSLPDAGMPEARATVDIVPLVHGSRRVPSAVVAQGTVRPLTLEIGYVSFLVRHREAVFVVDPALGADGGRAARASMPLLLRSTLRPTGPVRGLGELLADAAVTRSVPDFALATHLHWDHVAGLIDVPVPLRVDSRELAAARGVDRWGIFAPDTAPEVSTYELDGPPVLSFGRSLDLFGDGAVVLVDLAGHTPGSVGVLLARHDGSRVLLCGDAAWNLQQVRSVRPRAPLPGRLVDSDPDEALHVLHRLKAASAQVEIVPSHDPQAVRAVLGDGRGGLSPG